MLLLVVTHGIRASGKQDDAGKKSLAQLKASPAWPLTAL
jgi:hypothetical protein